MGAAYQTAPKDVQKELDRIRQEASDTSSNARDKVDAAINNAVAAALKTNAAAKAAIQAALGRVISDWDNRGT